MCISENFVCNQFILFFFQVNSVLAKARASPNVNHNTQKNMQKREITEAKGKDGEVFYGT